MGPAADPDPAGPHGTVHATCIAISGRAALLRGPSGSGKSDLALRCLGVAATPLIAGPARLVADDRVVLRRQGAHIVASAPPAIAGRIEVRGVGILVVDALDEARVVLLVDLVDKSRVERLQQPGKEMVQGIPLPVLQVWPFETSAAFKLLIAIGEHGVASPP